MSLAAVNDRLRDPAFCRRLGQARARLASLGPDHPDEGDDQDEQDEPQPCPLTRDLLRRLARAEERLGLTRETPR